MESGTTPNKTDSASVVLKLYELRRDPEMREAREWYLTKFNPKSAEDIVKLLMESFEGSRYYRMVTSYWDMAASLVNNGAIDRTVFLDANTEHIAILAKIHPYLAEVQKLYRDTYRTFAKAGKVSRLELILPWSYESNTSNVLPISSQ